MEAGVWKIYDTGDLANEDYRKLFETEDLTANPEILWFKMFDGDKGECWRDHYLNTGGGNIGICASLVDDYLSRDGKPLYGTDLLNLKKNYPDELDSKNRDHDCFGAMALSQPWHMQPEKAGKRYGCANSSGRDSSASEQSYGLCAGHVQIDFEGDYLSEYKGTTPAISSAMPTSC